VTHYLIRRLLLAVLTLWLITFIIMALIRNMPGDPLRLIADQASEANQSAKVTAQMLEDMRKSYGLDKPWYVGYWTWLGNVVQGDLGRSIYDQRPVTERIGERIGPTLTLSTISITLVYLLSIPIGLYTTARAGRWQEQLLSTFFYVLYSIPSFVMALYLILLVAVRLKLLPLGAMKSDDEVYGQLSMSGKAFDQMRHLVLPVFCYTYGSFAYMTRFIRSNMLEVIRQDYVRTARAKGLDEKVVFLKHAFRNTLIPLVTLLGFALPGMLSGSVILEQIFSWPGMGQLYFTAISTRDYPIIMGLTFTFACLALIGNLLADILYAIVDPRIAYS
jgi:peptide/nickel transport system permease protein